MTNEKKHSERNYGIDLLRLIAMIFVVILHTLGSGGLLDNPLLGTFKYNTAWFMETFAYCAVDILILITGYISYRKTPRKNILNNYLNLWVQVFFYLVVITLLFQVFQPGLITRKAYVNMMFPVLTNQYWYFTTYTGLVVLIPVLDEALRRLSNKNLKVLFILLILLFAVYGVMRDSYGLNGGYSVIWFVILYFLGGIIKKCDLFKKINNKKILLIMIGLFVLSFLYIIINKDLIIADVYITNIFAVNYTSPTILLISIGYLCIFSRLKFNSKINKFIAFFAPTTFAIYLLNSNHILGAFLLENRFLAIWQDKTIIMVIKVIAFSLIFSLIAMLIDKVRIKIFNKLNVKKYTKIISEKISEFCIKISSYI